MGTVLVTGTFNFVHAGHCELLEFASRFGHVVVGVNGDQYLKKKYGEDYVPLVQRVKVLESNRFVDQVVSFEEDEPSELIRKVSPDYYVKGPDYLDEELPEHQAIEEVSARLIIHQADKIQDSSSLIRLKHAQARCGR